LIARDLCRLRASSPLAGEGSEGGAGGAFSGKNTAVTPLPTLPASGSQSDPVDLGFTGREAAGGGGESQS